LGQTYGKMVNGKWQIKAAGRALIGLWLNIFK
jgi:hypothetical protein